GSPCLGTCLPLGEPIGVRRPDLGVIAGRVLVDANQVLGGGSAREPERQKHRYGHTIHIFPFKFQTLTRFYLCRRVQKLNSGGRGALINGSMTVSNKLVVVHASSDVRRTS